MLFVDSSQAPLTLYGPNPEHAPEFFYEASGAANFRILGIKTEADDLFTASTTSNLMVAGLSGDYGPGFGTDATLELTSCTNATLANLTWYAGPYTGNLLSVNGADYSFSDALSLVEMGSFDPTAFPHCGDGVCDGAEDSSNCPQDCGDGGTGSTPDAGEAPDAGSSPVDGGASWSACVAQGAVDWGTVPSFLVSHDTALITKEQVIPASDAVLSATVQTAWDNQRLYVRVQVVDPQAVNNPSLAPFESNAVELYLDVLDSRTSSYGPGDVQLVVSEDDHVFADPASAASTAHQVEVTDAGYAVSFTIPWASLGTPGSSVGFDVAVDQNVDGGAQRVSQLMWSGDGGAWTDPRQFGQLRLSNTSCASFGPPPSGGTNPGAGPIAGSGCGCGNGTPAPIGILLSLIWIQRRVAARRVGSPITASR
jgi:hypothetical protein